MKTRKLRLSIQWACFGAALFFGLVGQGRLYGHFATYGVIIMWINMYLKDKHHA